MKRFFDIFISFIVLVLISPLILIITFMLVLSVGVTNVFFQQERIGMHSASFKVLKYKTMSDKKDNLGKLLPDNERLTMVGSFLRKTSLDEFPQLLNVLRGEMSLVGPRPLLPKYLPLYSKEQSRRHEVKPGITGWAQVNGRNNISWKKKFELDVWYVDNQSIILDVKILWLTFLKVIKRVDITMDNPQNFKPFNGHN